MRKILAFSFLFALAAVSIGCSKNDQGGAANTNATGTTTYSNQSAPTTTTAAPSGGGAAAPKATPTAPGIKPPTDK